MIRDLKNVCNGLDIDVVGHEVFNDCIILRPGFPEIDKRQLADYTLSGPVSPSTCDKIWPSGTHKVVIVDRLCGEAVLRGSDIFVRGIICADKSIRKGAKCAVYTNVGTDLINRGALLDTYNGHCIYLGTGEVQVSRGEIFYLERGIGVIMTTRVGPLLPALNGVLRGRIMMQNIPSMVVAHALGAQPGETVIDMCAAPGGKTCHLSCLMKNDGLLVACDKSRKKMEAAQKRFLEMGATCIVPLALDSTRLVRDEGAEWKSVREIIDGAPNLRVKQFSPESFDRVLLDPPCSALGVRPKLLVQSSLNDLVKPMEYQKKFVNQAILLLKIGGTMTYSTCTINATENEFMVRWILDNFPNMKLVPVGLKVGTRGLPDVGLNSVERDMVCRFDPSDDDQDMMGFFLSKFVKLSRQIN